jgi:hypothetical protein
MRLLKLFAVFAALMTVAVVSAVAARADTAGPPWGPATPNFNLEVVLRPVAGAPDNGFGLVKFRQPKDADITIDLGVWVRDVAPSHSYFLQRAVDTTVDDNCTGTGWLILGTITTDETGTGRANLFRTLPASMLGKQFDIHFRVVDAVTSAVVLESACYQYIVSQ